MNIICLNFSEYANLVEQAPIMIWRANETMGYDYFNKQWLSFTGRTIEQERGNGWAEGIHPEDLPRCMKIYSESFQLKEPFEMEYRLRRADGVFRWLFDRGVPFKGSTGEFAGYIGSCIDTTARNEAQLQLKATQEAEMQRLRKLIPVCAWCRKIREDNGYWNEIESYMTIHFQAKFSHGICPECQSTHFPCVVSG